MQRRHLSLEERAIAGAQLANLQHGGNRGNQHTGGKFARANLATSETTTTRQAAARVGASYGSVVRAKAILSKGTEADVQEVLSGKTTLTQKAESLVQRTPRISKAKPPPKHTQPKPNPTRGPNRVIRLHDAPPIKVLTREQVDPEFKGTPMEWVDKYGHVQIMTAEQYATEAFDAWASNARALAKRWRELPELGRDVDHNWLRSPKQYSVRTLTESLEFLRPKIAELEALLATATAALAKKKPMEASHQGLRQSARG
jgi:hypothetical protein